MHKVTERSDWFRKTNLVVKELINAGLEAQVFKDHIEHPR